MRSIHFALKLVEALIAMSGQVLSSKGIHRKSIKSNCKITLLINFGIGNVLMVSPILKTIKKYYPDSYLTVVGEKSSLQIIRYNPYCDKFYYLKHSIFKNILLFSRLVCDVFVCAFPGNSFKSAVYGLFSSAPIRVGYSYPTLLGYSSLFFTSNPSRTRDHIVEKNVKLLKFLNIRVKSSDKKPKYYFNPHYYKHFSREFLGAKDLIEKKLAAFHLGAANSGLGRRWAMKNFDELAVVLENLGYVVLIFIGPDEMTLVPQLKNFSSNCIIVEGMNLDEVARLLQECDFIISNDSSLMHIAAAVGTPSVGIYGPTNPSLSSPYCSTHEAVVANFECSPCYTADKSLSCKIGYKCMKTISVQDVLQAVERLQKRIGQTK